LTHAPPSCSPTTPHTAEEIKFYSYLSNAVVEMNHFFGSFGHDSDPDPNLNPGVESGSGGGAETTVSDPQHCFSLNAGPDQADNVTVNIPEG
jgi:hypothetical protein